MREMGIWMKRHSAHFLKDTYLRHDGWVLSDTRITVRFGVVGSLQSLHAKSDYLVNNNKIGPTHITSPTELDTMYTVVTAPPGAP